MKYEEAIKLKPGTPILIRSKVVSVDATGDIVYEAHAHGQEYEVMYAGSVDYRYVDIQTAPPKYDPCRLFRKGDKVRVVDYKGRGGSNTMLAGTIGVVALDETEDDWVNFEAEIDGKVEGCYIDPAYLELVTPTEELALYRVEAHEDGECGCFEVMQGNKCVSIYPYGTHETRYYKKAAEAKAAAEAECDRLNSGHRKEQNYNQN